MHWDKEIFQKIKGNQRKKSLTQMKLCITGTWAPIHINNFANSYILCQGILGYDDFLNSVRNERTQITTGCLVLDTMMLFLNNTFFGVSRCCSQMGCSYTFIGIFVSISFCVPKVLQVAFGRGAAWLDQWPNANIICFLNSKTFSRCTLVLFTFSMTLIIACLKVQKRY